MGETLQKGDLKLGNKESVLQDEIMYKKRPQFVTDTDVKGEKAPVFEALWQRHRRQIAGKKKSAP